MSRIELNTFKKCIDDVGQFRVALFIAMDDELFYFNNVVDIICYSLNCISEFNNDIPADSDSIEHYCQEVLSHFGFGDKEVLIDSSGIVAEGSEAIPKLKTAAERYVYHILNLEALPSSFYLPAKIAIENELRSLMALIKKYEETEEFNVIVKNKGIRHTHSEKTIWDFYQRCIAEQREILNFNLIGVKARALHKASIKTAESSFMWLESHLDHPYKYGLVYNESFFNYDKIEKIAHRFIDYPDAIKAEMAKLYSTDKKEYYHKLSTEYPEAKVFNEYDYYIGRIASTTNRKEIFEELKILFKNKHWFGFYALALTQVEGLFTEMQLMIEKSRKGSLPEKVKIVRQGHLNDPSLDYYEYHIPTLRNKFLHIGHDDEIQFKAIDLFYDLSHVLILFLTLDNPYQILRNIIDGRRQSDFSTIEEVLKYFGLLDRISQKRPDQFDEIKMKVQEFERDFLMQYCDIDFLAADLVSALPKKIQTLAEDCKIIFGNAGVAIDIENMHFGQLKTVLSDKNNIEKIKEVFDQGHRFIEILQAKAFLEEYKNWLPSLPSGLTGDLSKCYEKNKIMFKKMKLFYESI